MKFTKTSKSLLLAGGIMLAFVVWQLDAEKSCTPSTQPSCQNIQHNWLNWLSGNSRSTQFHFVDFLELVSRLLPASAPKS